MGRIETIRMSVVSAVCAACRRPLLGPLPASRLDRTPDGKGPQLGHCGPSPSSGGVGGDVSAANSLLEPVQHLLLDPPDPALAKLYPFRELSGRLQAGDVLRAVEDKLPELTL